MAKGSTYEREVCKKLSLWWTKGKHDDVFWRSSTSGARATVRRRKGQRTSGHCGDISPTCPMAQPFMTVVTPELKRGYTSKSVAELLDKTKHTPYTVFEGFLQQAVEAALNAGSLSWWLITKRDKKEELVFMPATLWRLFEHRFAKDPVPFATLRLSYRVRKIVKTIKRKKKRGKGHTMVPVYKTIRENRCRLVVTTLSTVLASVPPKTFRRIARRFQNGKS